MKNDKKQNNEKETDASSKDKLLEELKKLSETKRKAILTEKDFSGLIIEGLDLERVSFVKCIFDSTTIYNSKFTGCEFSKDTFTGGTLGSKVDFIGCNFINSSFDGCKLSNVDFNSDCKFIDCDLSNIKKLDGVTGLEGNEENIITDQKSYETNDQTNIFENCGFVKQSDGTFLRRIHDDKKAMIYHDPEMEDSWWRMTFFLNDEAIFTTDFDINDLTEDYLNDVFEDGKQSFRRKILINFDTKAIQDGMLLGL